MAAIVGKVVSVRRAEKNPGAWFSAKLECPDGSSIRVKGHDPSLTEGEAISCEGSFFTDPKWGIEFRATSVARVSGESLQLPPQSPAFLILKEGVVRGIGEARARKLVDQHGDEGAIRAALKTLKKPPSHGRADELMRLGELMVMGLSRRIAERVHKEFGPDVMNTLRQHPYLLTRVDGVGFELADRIAKANGLQPDDRGRCAAGLRFVLDRFIRSTGSTGMPRKQLLTESQQLLALEDRGVLDEVLTRLERESTRESPLQSFQPVKGESLVFHRGLLQKEQDIAQDLRRRIARGPQAEAKDIQARANEIERMLGFGLHVLQREAVEQAAMQPVFVLTGGPGTGKTTTVKAIYDLLRQLGLRVALTAPTGKAAQRLGQACESNEAKTLHRLLEWHGQDDFKQSLKNPLAIDAVIVDEVSMVDVSLMHALLRALPEAARVILVGNKDQLPSVGPGQVLNDVLSSSETPRVLLEQGFRQGANSPIADNAIRVNTGELPRSSGQAFEIDWVEEGEGEEQRAADQLLLAYARLLEEGLKASDIQVLTPKREVGACSAFVLSKRIQALVNPQSERTLSQGGWTFRLGDRVINTQNNYSPDVMLANGDTGFVFDIGTEEEPSLTIQVDGDRRVVVKDALLNEIELAYALTVHKSQGSEFPVVMMPVIRAHRSLLSRRLVYTGMTRARQRLILIAGQGALKAAVGDTETYQRVSALPMMLAS